MIRAITVASGSFSPKVILKTVRKEIEKRSKELDNWFWRKDILAILRLFSTTVFYTSFLGKSLLVALHCERKLFVYDRSGLKQNFGISSSFT